MAWMQQHACEEAARLMSQQRDEPLGTWQRWRLRCHLRLCGDCRRVERQLAQLDALSREWLGGAREGEGPDAQR